MSRRKAKISLVLALWLILGIGASYAFLIMARSDAANFGIPFGENPEENATSTENSSDPGPISGPARLIIPKLDIDSNIQHVGLTSKGNMGVPTGKDRWRDVAWYKLGPKPGEKGNAAISGHLDNALGMNAVFADLRDLSIGDEVQVKDAAGKILRFRVIEKETYEYQRAPLEKIFGPTDKKRLNLITCEGDWIQAKKTYSHRLVVYTELIN